VGNVCLVLGNGDSGLGGTNVFVGVAFFVGDMNEWEG
jgi:hypothetical protein